MASKSKAYLVFLNISFVLLCGLFLKTQFFSSETYVPRPNLLSLTTEEGCQQLQKLDDYKAKCVYLKTQKSCDTSGLIDYLYLFYCLWGNWPSFGFPLLFIWLLVLFYLLGDTASKYFCSSLESLSDILKLSPAIAGVTLLSLGNGAPDVFASLVSFVGTGSRSVGVNSVLGGGFFITSIVVGIISILVAPIQVTVDKRDFVRDICFFLVGIFFLFVIVTVGSINVWGAMAFASLYAVYVLVVYMQHVHRKSADVEDGFVPLDSVCGSVPILRGIASDELMSIESENPEANGGWKGEIITSSSKSSALFGWFLYLVELPLSIPRRLTIPVVFEENWSKPYAVASVTLAPILIAALSYSLMSNIGFKTGLVICVSGGVVGICLGVIAFLTTNTASPPQKFVFPWLIGGFVMSVTWSYIIANELVALLVSIGYIFGISPSILGLTVLAWGNSLGDLITNIAMSMKGGAEGTQIAISGCYAGPIFNLLVGLGLSQIVSTWSAYPSSVVIAKDKFLLETMAFLVIGLVWALVVLPLRKMVLDRFFGIGLLVIYLVCISVRLVQASTLGSV